MRSAKWHRRTPDDPAAEERGEGGRVDSVGGGGGEETNRDNNKLRQVFQFSSLGPLPLTTRSLYFPALGYPPCPSH